MKKVFCINQVIFAAILFLIACEKEITPAAKEYKITHWPEVKTLEAKTVGLTAAKLNGTVNSFGLATTVTFEYGTTTSYDSTVTAYPSPVTDDGVTNVTAFISGLDKRSAYHFRVRAENSLWKNFYGSDITFTTLHLESSAITLNATNISNTGATLNGVVYVHNLPAEVRFEYTFPKSGGWRRVTAVPDLVTADSITNVSSWLNLQLGNIIISNITYRIVAENSDEVVYGEHIDLKLKSKY
jgi:hypothetical protein